MTHAYIYNATCMCIPYDMYACVRVLYIGSWYDTCIDGDGVHAYVLNAKLSVSLTLITLYTVCSNMFRIDCHSFHVSLKVS